MRAAELRRKNDLDGARDLYQRAGKLSGATAEAAWISLARLELSAGRARAAIVALEQHAQRFSRGALEPEAAWLKVSALDAAGEGAAARAQAQQVAARWPGSEQAKAAARWLEDQKR
jgi:hypothetical protein